jgi:hypothetical protein
MSFFLFSAQFPDFFFTFAYEMDEKYPPEKVYKLLSSFDSFYFHWGWVYKRRHVILCHEDQVNLRAYLRVSGSYTMMLMMLMDTYGRTL